MVGRAKEGAKEGAISPHQTSQLHICWQDVIGQIYGSIVVRIFCLVAFRAEANRIWITTQEKDTGFTT